MKDNELLSMVDEYLRDNDVSIGEFFDQLGIARANYSRWKNGRPISAKMRQRLTAGVMPTIATKSVNRYFDKCPPGPPPDQFLQIVLDGWNRLDTHGRAYIAAEVIKRIEKSSHEQIDDDMGKDCQAN